jgi:hypothetical protein
MQHWECVHYVRVASRVTRHSVAHAKRPPIARPAERVAHKGCASKVAPLHLQQHTTQRSAISEKSARMQWECGTRRHCVSRGGGDRPPPSESGIGNGVTAQHAHARLPAARSEWCYSAGACLQQAQCTRHSEKSALDAVGGRALCEPRAHARVPSATGSVRIDVASAAPAVRRVR